MNGVDASGITPALATKVNIEMVGRWVRLADGTFFHRDHIAGVLTQAAPSALANGAMMRLPHKCVVVAGGQMVGVDLSPEKMIAWLDANP